MYAREVLGNERLHYCKMNDAESFEDFCKFSIKDYKRKTGQDPEVVEIHASQDFVSSKVTVTKVDKGTPLEIALTHIQEKPDRTILLPWE